LRGRPSFLFEANQGGKTSPRHQPNREQTSHAIDAAGGSQDSIVGADDGRLPGGTRSAAGARSLDDIERTYRGYVETGRAQGLHLAARLLERYLDKGGDLTLTREEVLAIEPMRELRDRNRRRVAEAISATGEGRSSPWVNKIRTLDDGKSLVNETDHWQAAFDELGLLKNAIFAIFFTQYRDFSFGVGRTQLNS
jgi:hypothetical protein